MKLLCRRENRQRYLRIYKEMEEASRVVRYNETVSEKERKREREIENERGRGNGFNLHDGRVASPG